MKWARRESTAITSVRPAHAGILREDTVILRWLFGYSNEAHPSGLPWPDVPFTASPAKAKSFMRRIRLVSIDIDELKEDEQVIQGFHIGISVLDAQSLQNLLLRAPDPGTNLAAHVIQSHHYVLEDPEYSRKAPGKYMFGKCKMVSFSKLEATIRRHLRVPNFILVFHGGRREQSVLKRLDIKLDPIYTIDTVKAAQYPLQLYYRYSLEKQLTEFGIPFAHLHNAGNDAHFVLRVLLMIAVQDAERQLDKYRLPDWIPILKAVARAPRPPTVEERAAIRKEKQKQAQAKVMDGIACLTINDSVSREKSSQYHSQGR